MTELGDALQRIRQLETLGRTLGNRLHLKCGHGGPYTFDNCLLDPCPAVRAALGETPPTEDGDLSGRVLGYAIIDKEPPQPDPSPAPVVSNDALIDHECRETGQDRG